MRLQPVAARAWERCSTCSVQRMRVDDNASGFSRTSGFIRTSGFSLAAMLHEPLIIVFHASLIKAYTLGQVPMDFASAGL